MFVSSKRFDERLELIQKYHEQDINRLSERYWHLWHKHDTLLQHLGLSEVDVPAKTELRAKGGPEQP